MTPAEMDLNLSDIEGAVNADHAALSVALNPDGTLKNNSVSTAAIQNRAVTVDKRAFLSNFYAVDTGAANAMVISFGALPLSAYAAGLVFLVKVAATNTGASTLQVDAQAPRTVKKFTASGISDLTAGDAQAGGVYEFVDDGTQLVLLNPTAPDTNLFTTGPKFLAIPANVYSGGTQTWTTFDASGSIPVGAKGVILTIEASVADATDQPAGTVVKLRTVDNLVPELTALSTISLGDDPVRQFVQITGPVAANRSFDYDVSDASVVIILVGYVGV